MPEIDIKAIYKIAEAKRPNIDKAREAIDELTDLHDEAETFLDLDAYSALEEVNRGLEALQALVDAGLALDPEAMVVFVTMVSDLIDLLPEEGAVRAFVEAYDEAETAVEAAEEQKENPRDYSTDQKQEGREEVQSKLTELADALDSLTPVTPTEEPK